MKKTIMFLGVLSLGLAHAQQNDPIEGRVGINTETPKATLEIQPTATNLAGTTNEGIVAPKLSKTRVAAITDPVEGTLVYVTDNVYTAGSDATINNRVAKIDEKGYYYYDGTEWVKAKNVVQDQEWVYAPATKRINLRRSGGADMSNSSIFYNQHGAYINTNMLNETPSFFDYDTKTIRQSNPIEYDRLANNLLLKKITPDTYMPSNGDLSMNANFMYVEDTKDDGKSIILTGESTSLETSPTNVKDYFQLVGAKANMSHQGTGNAQYIVGNYSDGRLERGKSTGYVLGGRFTASYATNQSSNQQAGIYVFNQVVKTSEGRIDKMTDIVSYTAIRNGGPLTIREAKSLDLTRSLAPTAPLTITTAIGVDYQGIDVERVNNLTLTNNYGIKIGDIKGATTANYAIHTEAGQVRFGDLKGTGNRNVYADADGVLKVGDAGATQLSGTEGIQCNEENRGKMNFKKGENGKSDVFGVCLKHKNGDYNWAYLVGGNHLFEGTGAFGTGLQ